MRDRYGYNKEEEQMVQNGVHSLVRQQEAMMWRVRNSSGETTPYCWWMFVREIWDHEGEETSFNGNNNVCTMHGKFSWLIIGEAAFVALNGWDGTKPQMVALCSKIRPDHQLPFRPG